MRTIFMVISAIGFAHVSLAQVYTIRSPFGETVPIAFNSVVSVPIDAPSSTALARVKPLYVRAYEGRKADLRDVTKHERDPRTHCVKYYYHFRAPAVVDATLTLPGQNATRKWLNPSNNDWVLVPEDGTHPQGYIWIHEDLIDDYFGGGVQIHIDGPRYSEPPRDNTPYTGSTSGNTPGHFDLRSGLVRVPYSQQLDLTEFAFKSGTLPSGLEIARGELRGTPTREGSYYFVMEGRANRTEITYHVQVEDPVRLCLRPNPRVAGNEANGVIPIEIARCGVSPPVFWHPAADLELFFRALTE